MTTAFILIAAAASLADVMPAVARAYHDAGGPPVEFTFDASSRLARQIKEGSPVDGFISADEEWMDSLAAAGRIQAETRVDLLSNRLVAVVSSSSPLAASAPGDLAGRDVAHLALAGEAVPAGKYAEAALRSSGVWAAVQTKVVRADNVRAALRWVAAGEAEAALTYATDAAAEPRVRVAFVFPESSHPPIRYPAAAVKDAERGKDAAAFLRFCRGPEAARIFRAAGFGLPAKPSE
ncbi:MAG: molybdate ABC transporter substrate-binding protein [Elusimicrobia bacterium]|nr:molybdate ABC transporter substrate-binding protein [Elusimicrobiota bacterium]